MFVQSELDRECAQEEMGLIARLIKAIVMTSMQIFWSAAVIAGENIFTSNVHLLCTGIAWRWLWVGSALWTKKQHELPK